MPRTRVYKLVVGRDPQREGYVLSLFLTGFTDGTVSTERRKSWRGGPRARRASAGTWMRYLHAKLKLPADIEAAGGTWDNATVRALGEEGAGVELWWWFSE